MYLSDLLLITCLHTHGTITALHFMNRFALKVKLRLPRFGYVVYV